MKLHLLIAISVLLLAMVSTGLSAATFNVVTGTDSVDANPGDGSCADSGGLCSLRAAVMEANANGSGNDVINLPALTYTLTIPSGSSDTNASVGDLDIASSMTFVGSGAATTIIDASAMNHRAFDAPVDLLFTGSLSFSDLTITGGNTTALGTFNRGAAIDIGSRFISQVSFTNVVITGNTGASIIESRADTRLTDSSVSNNTGTGLTMTNDGAQVFQNVRELEIIRSTFEGNTGSGVSVGNIDGGELTNSTISGNGIHGIAMQFTNSNDFLITNSTIANNGLDGIAGIGFTIFDPVFGPTPVRPDIVVRSSIIADNGRSDVTTPAIDDQAEVPTSAGYNVVSDASAAGNFNQANDLNSTDPMLLPIALNAPGTTRTHALPGDSPAVDNSSGGPVTDQRGVDRPQGLAPDSGAYEFKPTVSALGLTKVADVGSAVQGDPVVFTITVTNAGPDDATGATVSDVPGADFDNVAWTCAPTPPSTCAGGGNGDIDDTVSIVSGGTIVYTLNANIALTAVVSATNTASVSLPSGAIDPDPENNTDSATVTLPNTPPVANDDSYSVNEDGQLVADDATGSVGDASDDGVLVNDTDADGDTLTVTTPGTFDATGLGGSVTLSADGTFTYDPPPDASGADSFSYTMSDGTVTDQATVTITVNPVNDAPSFVAGPDVVLSGGPGGQTLFGWATGFDPGPGEDEQNILEYLVSIESDPDGVVGSASIEANGNLQLGVTGAVGTATLTARVRDDGGVANGGVDTSDPRTFFVSVGSTADLRTQVSQCTSLSGPGFSHRYSARVSNNGPGTANGVVLEIVLPPDSSFAAAIPGAPTCVESSGVVACEIGSVAVGDTVAVDVAFFFSPTASGLLEAEATAAAVEPDPNFGNNTGTVKTEIIEDMVRTDRFQPCGGP
ncbi:MAG: Ig-like domain-containing protein [Wenzhouxiangella sp.]|jgi:uncharacterized repeat protein (TIGR01451 family)|nr:Ig-like domain-containing protein [Wenzhouxiangella sp.]